MTKVKVSRELAEAINERLIWDKPSEIVRTSVRNGWEERGRCNVGVLNSRNTSLDTFIKALYFGYEVEETPESKFVEWYRSLDACKYNADNLKRIGADTTLELLELKIEGVSA